MLTAIWSFLLLSPLARSAPADGAGHFCRRIPGY
jgi:hypothetical protein